MQSHLTRRVFRAILKNKPLRSPRCHHYIPHNIPSYRARRPGLSHVNHVQRRGFFALNMPTAPTESERRYILPSELALKTMGDLGRSLVDRSRGPSNQALTKAFREFFAARADSPGFITGVQAYRLHITWEHLNAEQENLESDDWTAVFSTESLENVLFVLSEAECLPESRELILNTARSVFLELCADHEFGPNVVSRPALVAYVNLLSLNGVPMEAQRVVEKFSDKLYKTKPSPWLVVMKGFALQDNREGMKNIAAKLHSDGTMFDPVSHEELIKFYIDQDLLQVVTIIYKCAISDNQEPTFAAKEAVFKYAVCKSPDKIAWARQIFLPLADERPIAEIMGMALLWEAARGKSAVTISEKVKTWTAGNQAAQEALTISCLNDLILFANARRNPQLAAEFAALGPQWGLQPDTQTKLLQLDSCVIANDLDGVLRLMRELPDLGSIASEHLSLMNKLIPMLCWSGREDALFNQFSGLLEPLLESNVRLKAETIAALTHFLLYQNDYEAVAELLRPRLGSYESHELVKIRDVLTDYILDANQSTDNVWGVYELLRAAFPETGVPMRSNIMDAFFQRDRSDLGCLVFGHMRQAEEPSRRPKSFAYARCFKGIARAGDAKNLELVHNMLRLDTEVNLNTQVRNGLMLAYACCDKAEKSMEIFREILQTEEGPTHRTIAIFFRACADYDNGVQEAIKMIEKAKLLEIGVGHRMYTAYILALAAHSEFELATEAVENMESEIGEGQRPSRKTLGLLYNAMPHQYWKDELEKWAKSRYPELWAHLSELPRSEHEEGLKFDKLTLEYLV